MPASAKRAAEFRVTPDTSSKRGGTLPPTERNIFLGQGLATYSLDSSDIPSLSDWSRPIPMAAKVHPTRHIKTPHPRGERLVDAAISPLKFVARLRDGDRVCADKHISI